MADNPPARPKSLFSSFLSATGMGSSNRTDKANDDNEEFLPPAPTTLLASTLPPALLGDPFSSSLTSGISMDGLNDSNTPRPRRLWCVQDKLKPIPPYYPPLDPSCTCLVTDVSPSLVASRIAECLRLRSISAEYDEESATAQCMTIDRVHFTINLYRGSKRDNVTLDDAIFSTVSPPVIVECQRQSGHVTSFHAACHAVLQAAKGNETGSDERKPQFTNGIEFHSLSPAVKRRKLLHATTSSQRSRIPPHQRFSSSTISSPSMAAEAAFEGARELLKKDRLECQVLGMERLVNLTNEEISGEDVCLYVSQRLLQNDWLIDSFLMHPEAEQAMASLKDIKRGTKSKRDRSNQELETTALIRSFLESSAALNHSSRSLLADMEDRNPRMANASSESHQNESTSEEIVHEAKLRSLALRVLCNSLYVLSKSGDLKHVLWHKKSGEQESKRKCGIAASGSSQESQPSRLVQPPFLLSLVQDMQGASRPPSVSEIGYKLASVHEAALAIRCLRLLAGSTKDISGREPLSETQTRVQDFLRNEVVLECLELARSCGRATHNILQNEAERTFTQFTEDVRSC